MAELNSNQKLVAVKAFARGNAIPLDASSVYDSKELANTYASTDPTAYEGQMISAIEDGKPKAYLLKKESVGYSLEPVGASAEDIDAAAPEWGTIV